MFMIRSVFICYFVLISRVHLETLNDPKNITSTTTEADDISDPKSLESRFFDFGNLFGNLFGSGQNMNQQTPLGNGNPIFQPAISVQPQSNPQGQGFSNLDQSQFPNEGASFTNQGQPPQQTYWDPSFQNSNQGRYPNQGSGFTGQGQLSQQRPNLNLGVQDLNQGRFPNQGLQTLPSNGQFVNPGQLQNQGQFPYEGQLVNQGQNNNQGSEFGLNQGQQGDQDWSSNAGIFPNQKRFPTVSSPGSGFGNQGQSVNQGQFDGFGNQRPLQQGQLQNQGQLPIQGQFNNQGTSFGNQGQDFQVPSWNSGVTNGGQNQNQGDGDGRPNNLSFLGITTESVPAGNNFNGQFEAEPTAILGRPVTVPSVTTPVGQIVFNEISTESPVQIQCVQDCRTTSEYSPVCGSNNVTYFNPARFMCARNCGVHVFIQRRGRCDVPVIN